MLKKNLAETETAEQTRSSAKKKKKNWCLGIG